MSQTWEGTESDLNNYKRANSGMNAHVQLEAILRQLLGQVVVALFF